MRKYQCSVFLGSTLAFTSVPIVSVVGYVCGQCPGKIHWSAAQVQPHFPELVLGRSTTLVWLLRCWFVLLSKPHLLQLPLHRGRETFFLESRVYAVQ